MTIPTLTSHRLQVASQRWFVLPERVLRHPTITRYRMEPSRFKTVHAGRRSFKTEIAKRTLVTEAMSHSGIRLFFGSPTRDQAKKIAWDCLKKLSAPVISSASETELWLKLTSGSEIHVIGFDKPERFEGSLWHGGILDEYADMKPTVWTENVLPALTDTKGWCWLIGVPGGKNHYFELVQYARNSGDPNWKDYNWLSSEVLDPQDIEQFREQYDERTFRQEFEGSFESYEGRAYVYYDSESHRKPQLFDPRIAVSVSCDFNLDPCIWIIGQDKSGFISVQDEIKQSQTDIWRMCSGLKDKLTKRVGSEAHKHLLLFYGDYEHGQSRSVSATASSWQIIRDEFKGWNVEFRLRGHPRIIDRVNSVNSKLRTAKGAIQLSLDPCCTETHKDFEMVDMAMLQNPQDKSKMKDRTHASDCVGYWVNYEYPLRRSVFTQS
jgi:hypothetical protein